MTASPAVTGWSGSIVDDDGRGEEEQEEQVESRPLGWSLHPTDRGHIHPRNN